jgi:hypothetical protein
MPLAASIPYRHNRAVNFLSCNGSIPVNMSRKSLVYIEKLLEGITNYTEIVLRIEYKTTSLLADFLREVRTDLIVLEEDEAIVLRNL